MRQDNIILNLIIALLLCVSAVSAAQINYDIEATVLEANDATNTTTQSMVQECENTCEFQPPSFSLNEGASITGYKIIYDSSGDYSILFKSSNDISTENTTDMIVVKFATTVEEPASTDTTVTEQQTTPVCSENKCDRECVKCGDGICNAPGTKCVEDLMIDKIFPNSIKTGTAQINVIIKNTGTVGLKGVRAELSGDGITTTDSSIIDELPAGEKDYAFVQVDAEKAGPIDLVVKIYYGGALKKKFVEQITVNAPQTIVVEKNESEEMPAYDVKILSEKLESLKDKYKSLEQEYQTKKSEGYDVGTIYDDLKEAKGFLNDAQTSLYDANYKKVESSLSIAQDSMQDIADTLGSLKKAEVKFMDKVKNNLIYVGSIAAAIVSSLTAFSLIRNHVNKQNLAKIADRVRKNGVKKKEKHKRGEKKPKKDSGKKSEESKKDSEEVKKESEKEEQENK